MLMLRAECTRIDLKSSSARADTMFSGKLLKKCIYRMRMPEKNKNKNCGCQNQNEKIAKYKLETSGREICLWLIGLVVDLDGNQRLSKYTNNSSLTDRTGKMDGQRKKRKCYVVTSTVNINRNSFLFAIFTSDLLFIHLLMSLNLEKEFNFRVKNHLLISIRKLAHTMKSIFCLCHRERTSKNLYDLFPRWETKKKRKKRWDRFERHPYARIEQYK